MVLTVPGAPTLEDAVDNAAYSFEVVWQAPSVTNGELVAYNLTVEPRGPAYVVSQNCSVEELPPQVLTLEASQTNYKFEDARPYHAYAVYIQAATSRGYGVESVEKIITTEPTGEITLPLKIVCFSVVSFS